MEVVGQILSGEFGELLVRQKSGEELELGELLVTENGNKKTILQVYNLLYASQIPPKSLELLSGMELEGHGSDLGFMEADLRNYVLAEVKGLVSINAGIARMPKTLPSFFSPVRRINKADLDFLGREENALYVGNIRSGSKDMGIPVELDGRKVLSHHVLISATTGRGKSNLVRIMSWSAIDKNYCGMLILDPHDEYYNGPGGKEAGLGNHPRAGEKIVYYSTNPPAGAETLRINYHLLKPWFFQGVLNLSPAQRDALFTYYKLDKEEWVANILSGEPATGVKEETLAVLIRKLNILGISSEDGTVKCEGVFAEEKYENTLENMVSALEMGKTVIVDTSPLSSELELLISSMVASEALDRYKYYKKNGKLSTKPVISIIIEEAPRVLGKDVLQAGPNIFSTIAREGRKFKIGLIAITQLPSLIPREVLANMNTKIILGIEMEPERRAIIESASQDLSKDGRNIASLDKGEALITSTFTKFAIPVHIPLFDRDFISGSCQSSVRQTKTDLSEFS